MSLFYFVNSVFWLFCCNTINYFKLQTAVGGGGGDIGKKINHGGGDGGDDDGGDDDDYFDDFDEGDDGDEGGLFRRRMFLEEVSYEISTYENISHSFAYDLFLIFCSYCYIYMFTN